MSVWLGTLAALCGMAWAGVLIRRAAHNHKARLASILIIDRLYLKALYRRAAPTSAVLKTQRALFAWRWAVPEGHDDDLGIPGPPLDGEDSPVAAPDRLLA